MRRKGFALPIILGGIFALVLAIGIGLAAGTITHNKLNLKSSPKSITIPMNRPKPLQTQILNQTITPSDWETYTNKLEGYEISYPNNWKYFDCITGVQYGGPCILSDDYISSGGDSLNTLTNANQIFTPMQGVLLTIINEPIIPEPDQPISCPSFSSNEENLVCKVIDIGGLPSIKTTKISPVQIPGGEKVIEIYYYINEGANFRIISIHYPECERRSDLDGSTIRDCSNISEVPPLINKIISTFLLLT